MKNRFLRLFMVVGLIFSHLAIVTCDKNPADVEEAPPAMPPPESMMMDLTLFSAGGAQSLNKADMPETQQHFGTALVTVSLINISVALHLAIPVYIFGRALLEQPVLQSDGKFHWMYSPVYQLIKYEADLAGWVEILNAQVNWEMYVTQNNLSLSHYRWYSGHCNIDATEGNWTFYDYKQPDSQVPVIQIDWQILDETHRTLAFENIFEGNENLGDQLTYQIDGDSARVQYYNALTGNTSKIVWNLQTTAGYIYSPGYNNGVPGHWDENRQDM